MQDAPDWLPQLIKLENFGGDWQRYIDEVFAIFYKDFIESQPKFREMWVRCRRDLLDGKEAGFWHCVSEGADEANRNSDLRRCERIRWVRVIIENYGGGPVGAETLAISIGEAIESLEDFYEPFLIQRGFLKRTPRGRVATPHAYKHLGLSRKGNENQGILF